ncbi:MAG: UDP-N-acetylmuramoyl-L-alanyl-D-glutamate--2,6-diaminopimelate ligase [Candidatus Andersenbacteria bacterium]
MPTKAALRRLVPRPLLFGYHAVLNWLSMAVFGFPTRRLITIGVTGTTGKTSVVSYISDTLESAGVRTGYVSTATVKIGSAKRLNQLKMTMPGRWTLARMLAQIRRSGAQAVVIETSSQGLEMYRHLGIAYDVAVFTNLTPEHIEAHGSFEAYRSAKERLFAALAGSPRKTDRVTGKPIKKIIVANLDDANAKYFLQYDADEKWGFSLAAGGPDAHVSLTNVVRPSAYSCGPEGISFTLRLPKRELHKGSPLAGQTAIDVRTKLVGIFNLQNMLAAASVALSQEIPLDKIKTALEKLEPAPGRMEPIVAGQPFSVVVDYAHVPESLELVYKTLRDQLAPGKKLIAVLGSAGGGRDVAKRPRLGALAGRYADFVVVTNEDPYDEDPVQIINQVKAGVLSAGKPEAHKNRGGSADQRGVVAITDRRAGMRRALRAAQPGDIVVITGKGCEPVIMSKDGARIPHDDRTVARELLRELLDKQ